MTTLITSDWKNKAEPMPYVCDDGGRGAAGFKGKAGDCVTRSIAIASGQPYAEVYAKLAEGMGSQRASKKSGKAAASARNGVNVKRKWFKDYMRSIGFRWIPTMLVGQGCKVHLAKGELPMGRLVVAVSKHYTAVVNGVIRDTHDPTRTTISRNDDGVIESVSHRCVYGYWYKTRASTASGSTRPPPGCRRTRRTSTNEN